MSTLNLKQYLAKIDILLEDNYFDEAIFHSRHILSLHPKNLATYRRLGRAEVGANRWDDANNTLRRILSFMPDDKIAHMGLSKVYQRAKKQDEALWHLERAYEQEPNNQAIIDELRELYRAYKNASNVRLQLTAGAVGRQYAKNQLYPQAIQVLKGALKQTPQRIDLRLMLARVYRESGDVVAAAETALDVLDALPDCLDANYIMTEVWLSEQRPSDAQRYLSVVEAIDPYLAIRLAQGHPAPDDLVDVPIADYKKTAQTLTDQKPDWLTEIDDGQNPLVELAEEDWASGTVDDPTLRLNTDQLLTTDFGDDDLSWLDDPTSPVSAEETHIPENTRKRAGLSGMLTKFDDNATIQGDDPHSIPTEEISFDDLFNASADANDIPADEDENDDVMAWLTDMPQATEAPTPTPSSEKSVHTTDTDDPLSWLRDSGIELNTDTLSDEMITRTKAPTQALDPDDPMSWLHASGIELVDENPDEVFTPYEKVDSTTLKDGDEDPMAWLRDSGVEIDEDMPRKNIVEDDDADDDPMAWLNDSGIELIEDDDETPIPTPTATSTPLWQEDNSLLDEMLSMEDLTGQPDMQVASLNSPALGTETDWQDTMLDDSSDDFPDWLSDSQPIGDDEDFSFDDTQDDDDTPDWLMDAKPTDANFDPDATNIGMFFGNDANADDADSDTDTPDWLMDMKPTESPVAETDFDFLSDDIVEEALVTDDDTPDWLMDMKPAESPVAETDFDFLSDDEDTTEEEADTDFAFAELSSDDDDTPDWLSGVTSSTEEESDADFAFAELSSDADDALADDDDTPDWLSGMGATDESVEEESDTNFAFAELSSDDDALVDDDDTPDWLTSMGESNESEEEADTDFAFAELSADDDALADDDDTPDWLSGMGATDESVEEEADTDFAFAELSSDDDDALADDDDTPDWLSGMGATDESAEEEADTDFAFAELSADDDALADDDETPDWLSGMGATDESAEEEADTDFAFAELSADDDALADDDDTPDWLSGMGATDESVEEEADTDFAFAELSSDDDDALADDDDTPDWLSGVTSSDTEEEADTDFAFAELSADDDALADDDDTPDWLTSMGATDESAEEESDADFAFAELSSDDDALADDDDTPDWLTSMKPAEAVSEVAEEEFDFLADDLVDDDSLVTEDAPEWLMDARPEAETDRALDWLADDESEEAVAEDTPSWLSALDDDAQEELTVEEEATWLSEESGVGEFDETVPVLAEIGALTLSDEAAELHTPAENAPDWLNALVPGLDIDYDADEDAPVEQHFLTNEAVAAASAKFAWLNTIVEAEVNQPPMTMPSVKTIVTAPSPTPRRNWSFSRPPAWLTPSQPTGIKPISRVQNPLPTSDADLDKFDDDDDDDDVPDWLLDDNDDEPDFLRDNF